MFQCYELDSLPYTIISNDGHMYEDKLKMNINVF